MGAMSKDLSLEIGHQVQEKNKKKKKKQKGSLQSPKQIVTFDSSKLLKLDEQRAETRKCSMNGSTTPLSKCQSLLVNNPVDAAVEGSGDSQEFVYTASLNSSQETTSMPSHEPSSFLRSALKGGFEEHGNGPRPKLHVHWDASVWEPPSSTVSHTATKKSPKKKKGAPRQGRNSKLSVVIPCMRECHTPQNGRPVPYPNTMVSNCVDNFEEDFPDGDTIEKGCVQDSRWSNSSVIGILEPEWETSDRICLNNEVSIQKALKEEQKTAVIGTHYASESVFGGPLLVGA
ncbi:hypothetical protein KP509_10G083900 [Ceratopteris richardii]|uniref:Uncharacterized protein n=1 Tax=Ceratopteris richardii TaxID=49495 RepID=A0A8T2U2Y9_CERRI|nr:hypothetical protein KP509_10G083900 [Ceratopteris richardii]KAH7428267.1 hypothetical protein KP509_10G083900 [Ceratopteris richardii]